MRRGPGQKTIGVHGHRQCGHDGSWGTSWQSLGGGDAPWAGWGQNVTCLGSACQRDPLTLSRPLDPEPRAWPQCPATPTRCSLSVSLPQSPWVRGAQSLWLLSAPRRDPSGGRLGQGPCFASAAGMVASAPTGRMAGRGGGEGGEQGEAGCSRCAHAPGPGDAGPSTCCHCHLSCGVPAKSFLLR